MLLGKPGSRFYSTGSGEGLSVFCFSGSLRPAESAPSFAPLLSGLAFGVVTRPSHRTFGSGSISNVLQKLLQVWGQYWDLNVPSTVGSKLHWRLVFVG